MAKKIAVINDLSSFGKCSLTAAIPVISVMGAQPCPLPTAVLSAQTGYGDYYLDDYTDRMDYFTEYWKSMEVSFDGIYTGFMASGKQMEHVEKFLDVFGREAGFLLVDPVMGDDGEPYPMFSEEFLSKMKGLVQRAQIVTPNVTELCLLTGETYEDCRYKERNHLEQKLYNMAEELLEKGTESVVVTGIRFWGKDGNQRVGNLVVTRDACKMLDFPYIGGSYSGTGDLFASVLAGSLARGDELFAACELAGTFIEKAMKDSNRQGIRREAGTEFEQHLGMLISKQHGKDDGNEAE